METKKAVGYIRVSNSKQAPTYCLEFSAQQRAISAYAAEHGYSVVDWMVDKIKGNETDFPALNQILYNDNASKSPYSAVIVYRNDYLAQDAKLYFYYLYILERRNIHLLSTAENFHESPEFVETCHTLLQFIAEQERKYLAQRTGRGRSIKAACGGYSGGRRPYGYKVVDGVLTIDEHEKEIVLKIFSEHDAGNTLTGISEVLIDDGYRTRAGKHFQPSTIASVLSNRPLYEGMYRYGNMDWVQGVHEPILKK